MTMTVKAAAEAAVVSPKAVRLWEAKGLLRPAERTASGYRQFSENDVAVLRFIRQAKALYLTLGEIKEILDLQRGGGTLCGRVTAMLDAHIADIDRTITDLRALRRSLVGARRAARESQMRGQNAVICRIIESDK